MYYYIFGGNSEISSNKGGRQKGNVARLLLIAIGRSLGGGGAAPRDIFIGRCAACHEYHRVQPSGGDQLTEGLRRWNVSEFSGSNRTDKSDTDMPSLLFCGPKLAACGIVISIWGIIMLVRRDPRQGTDYFPEYASKLANRP